MELEKLVNQIRNKKYKDKKSLLRDINILRMEIHNQLMSEIAKAKKNNKNVSDIEKELNKVLNSLVKIKKYKQAQSIRNIKFVVDKRGSEALQILKKLKQ